MPAKASCEVKIRTVHQPQKNGDIYVLERQTRYDPKSRVISTQNIRRLTSRVFPGTAGHAL